MDTSRTYAIEPASNGGLVVSHIRHEAPGRMPEIIGAFTTPADMIAWLAEQYGVPFAQSGVVSSDLMPVYRMGESAGETIIPAPTDEVWIDFNFAKDNVPVFEPDTIVKAQYGYGSRVRNTDPGALDWTRVTRYRVASGPSVAATVADHNNRRG